MRRTGAIEGQLGFLCVSHCSFQCLGVSSHFPELLEVPIGIVFDLYCPSKITVNGCQPAFRVVHLNRFYTLGFGGTT